MLRDKQQSDNSSRIGRSNRSRFAGDWTDTQNLVAQTNDYLKDKRKNSLKIFNWNISFFGNMVMPVYDSPIIHRHGQSRDGGRVRRSKSLPKREVRRRNSLQGECHPKRFRQINKVKFVFSMAYKGPNE